MQWFKFLDEILFNNCYFDTIMLFETHKIQKGH